MTCTQRGYMDIPRHLILKCGIRIQIIKIHCWIGERSGGASVHDETGVEKSTVIRRDFLYTQKILTFEAVDRKET